MNKKKVKWIKKIEWIQKVDKLNFHIHARIPGLNFFKVDEKVIVETDPTQIFIFEQ